MAETHPRRKYAVFMVYRAVKAGRLIRPASCSCCGATPGPCKDGRARIQAHHHNGYDDAHILDVEWLCPSCHKIKHPNDENALIAIADRNRGKKRSEESKRKQSETTRDYTPEQRGWTEERRERQRQTIRASWTPERRAAQAELARNNKPWLGGQ